MVNENVSLVISRQLLTDFCAHLPNLPDGTAKAVCHFTLEKIQPRVISFEEQVCVKNILGSMLESYGSCMSKSYILPGGFHQTASSHNLRERGGLEERCTGSCGNPAGDGSEVRFSFSLGTNWSLLFRWLVDVVLMIFSDIWFYRQYNVDYKLDTYLKIARLYLEDDDPVQAEAYINRASLLQNESTNEQLQIHYKVHHQLSYI